MARPDFSDRAMYMAMTAPVLKKIINDAVTKYNIDKSWAAPKTNDKEELVNHIDSLCNEFRCHPDQVRDDLPV